MRTTIDIEDDLLKKLREQARREGKSLRSAVNAALRQGLQGGRSRPKPYRCPVFSLRSPVSPSIDLDRALAVADALEEAEVARKLEARK